MKNIVTAAILTMAATLSAPARADVEIDFRGQVGLLHSDRLQPGDENAFRGLLASPQGRALRILYLDSRGGATGVALKIGGMIRARRLDTAFHVGRGTCVSACTTVFLGGVHRYYVGGDEVVDGVATHVGLGLHPSHGGARAEGAINAYYRNMGAPGTAELRYQVYSRRQAESENPNGPEDGQGVYKIFFVGGQHALRTGFVTSLDEPADPRLRDE